MTGYSRQPLTWLIRKYKAQAVSTIGQTEQMVSLRNIQKKIWHFLSRWISGTKTYVDMQRKNYSNVPIYLNLTHNIKIYLLFLFLEFTIWGIHLDTKSNADYLLRQKPKRALLVQGKNQDLTGSLATLELTLCTKEFKTNRKGVST